MEQLTPVAHAQLNLLTFLNNFFIFNEINKVIVFHEFTEINVINLITSHHYDTDKTWMLFNMRHINALPSAEIKEHVILWLCNPSNLMPILKMFLLETKHIFLVTARANQNLLMIGTRFMNMNLNGILVNWFDNNNIKHL